MADSMQSGSSSGTGPVSMPKQAYLTNMWIEWCDGDGNVYTRWIDVTKISGLIWASGPSGPAPNPPKHPKIPGSKDQKVAGVSCGPQPPSGGECCYWDGIQWVCPDDFAAP